MKTSNQSPTRLKRALLGFASVVAISTTCTPTLALAQTAQVGDNLEILLPVQPLENSLKEIADQSGVQIVLYSADAAGISAPALEGNYTLEQALDMLLSGTDLGHQRINGRTIAVALPSQLLINTEETEATNPAVLIEPAATPRPDEAPKIGEGDTEALEPAEEASIQETIIVRGEKFGRSLSETSTSVGILGSTDIQDFVLLDSEDAYGQLVNVNTLANNRFVIRGIPFDNLNGAGFGQLGTVYVDGVRLGDKSTAFGPDLLWDVKSFEVLRGAQSTLQGRNALAGAIYISTKDPSYEWDRRARLVLSENNTYSAAFAVGGPIVDDKLAFRLTGEYRESDGDIYNPVRGADEETVEDLQLRAKILFEPTQDLTINGVVNFADINRSEAFADTRVLGADGFLPANPNGGVGSESGIFGQGDVYRRQVFNNVDYIEENETLSAGLTVDYRLNDALTLTSQTTYSYTDDFEQDDGDGGIFDYSGYSSDSIAIDVPFIVNNFAHASDGTVPVDPIALQNEEFTIFAQEFRLKYDNGGKLRGLFGAYYTEESEEEENFSVLLFRNTQPLVIGAAQQLGGLDAATAAGFAALYETDLPIVSWGAQPFDVTNYAVFGELEYDITPQLKAVVGARYDNEELSSENDNNGIIYGLADPATLTNPLSFLAAGVNTALDPFTNTTTTTDLEFDAFLPKFGLVYELNDDISVGAQYQKAYRAGGVTTNPVRSLVVPVDPEYSDNYELYLRQNLGDRGLLRANAFLTNWTDQQVIVDLSSDQFDNIGVNAGESELYGFEVEFDYRLTDAFTLKGGLGYLQTEFVEFDVVLPPITGDLAGSIEVQNLNNLQGNSFANAPEWNAVIGGTWSHGNWFASSDAVYTGKSFANTSNTLENPSTFLVNARAGYNFGDVRATVFARNLFDDQPSYPDFRTVNLIPSRQFGIVLEAKF